MSDEPRQHIERVPGRRRARLTAVPGTDPAPDVSKDDEDAAPAIGGAERPEAGPNDKRLLDDVPPHY